MVDREARDKMAAVIRSYMDVSITTFQFDEMLAEIVSVTEDKTVHDVRWLLWFCYDCDNHNIHDDITKEGWDYLNRILLLMESNAEDAEIIMKTWRWTHRELVSTLFLAVYVAFGICTNFWSNIFTYWACNLPVAIVLAILSRFSSRNKSQLSTSELALTPFPSRSFLLSVRRAAPGFKKMKYSGTFVSAKKGIWHQFIVVLWIFIRTGGLTLFLPLWLLFMAVPKRTVESKSNWVISATQNPQ